MIKLNEQTGFNSYINYYFDNKTVFNQSKKKYNKETLSGAKKLSLNFKKTINRNTNLSRLNIKKHELIKDNSVIKKLKSIVNRNSFLKKNLTYFLVHGSYASDDFINQWSDIDTFVVIKDSVFLNQKKIIKLRNEVKKLYNFFYKVCRYQHHGLILFTESDLRKYSSSYLPLEALSPCVKILGFNHIDFYIQKNKKNFFLEKLKKRIIDFEMVKKLGIYKHHAKNSEYLKYPLKKNAEEMFQLHVVINYVISLPIYLLSSLNQSENKKKSFKKFYEIIKDHRIKKTIENSRFIRKKWKTRNDDKIPEWVIKKLGVNYFKDIVYSMKFLIKKIERK